jgi:hypothetical protein
LEDLMAKRDFRYVKNRWVDNIKIGLTETDNLDVNSNDPIQDKFEPAVLSYYGIHTLKSITRNV